MIAPSSFDPWVAGQGRSALSARDAKSPADAAQAFEALLLRQLLATARSTSWLSGESETESGWREMADDALAGHLAKVGGLGLAKQITSLLGQARGGGFTPSFRAGALPTEDVPGVKALKLPSEATVTRLPGLIR